MPGVRLQHPGGGGPRAHRRAGRVPPLQQHPQSGAGAQPLRLLRQADGESRAEVGGWGGEQIVGDVESLSGICQAGITHISPHHLLRFLRPVLGGR